LFLKSAAEWLTAANAVVRNNKLPPGDRREFFYALCRSSARSVFGIARKRVNYQDRRCMMQIPKLAIVGVGDHGFGTYIRQIIPRLRQEKRLEPVAVIDTVPQHRARAAEALGLCENQLFEETGAALEATRPDALIVATPYFAHEAVCRLAAERRVHLFIEKPVSDSLESSCAILKATRAAGVKAAVNMSARFEADKMQFGQLLAAGEIGRVEYVFGRMSWNHEGRAKYRAEAPHPYLMEGGVHALDMLRQYAGGKPRRVFNLTWPVDRGAFTGNASAVVSMEFDNGVRAVLEGSWNVSATTHFWRNEYIRADGSEAALRLDHRRIQRLQGHEYQKPGLAVHEIFPSEPDRTSTLLLVTRFLEWIQGETREHPTDLDDNIQCMALLFAAMHSGDTGQAVDVQQLLAPYL
jgi:predicted dehydrogenase